MDTLTQSHGERRERALAALAEKPDGVIEQIAAKAEVTPADVLAILPEGPLWWCLPRSGSRSGRTSHPGARS